MTKNEVLRRGHESLFKVGRAVVQIIGSGAWVPIQWDIEFYDLLDEMAIVAPFTFIPKSAGYYFLSCATRFLNMGLGNLMYLGFRIDGVANQPYQTFECSVANQECALIVNDIEYLTPNNAVDVVVWHNFGANRNIQGNFRETWFIGNRLK